MNDKYLHKSVEEIAAEKKFIDWVKNEKYDDAWKAFLNTYPNQIDKINKAIYLVNAVHFAETKPIANTQIKNLWDRIENTIEVSEKEEKLIKAEKKKAIAQAKQEAAIIRKKNFRSWLAAAVMIGILTFAFLFLRSNETQFQAKFAQKIEKTLPDNSKIWINAGSSVVFDNDFKGKNRKVTLTGEAQFQVTKGIGKFIVKTENATVTVLGTKFNIKDRDHTFTLECFEGKVQVQVGNQKEIVTGGNAISYNDSNKKTRVYTVTKDTDADWIKGEIQYTATPLSTVIHELERQFDIKIDYKDNLSQKQYSGFFKTDNLENALQSVFWPMKKKFKIEGKRVSVY